jgi:hypothetical protein
MRTTKVRLGSAAFCVIALQAVLDPCAHAHNARVHRDMTDRAYHVMLALAADRLATGGDPALTELATAARKAIRKLQAVPAGLPTPKDSRCIDPETIKKIGTNTPSWPAFPSFAAMPLGAVPYPIATTYMTGTDCGIDPDWSPGAFFDTVNAGGPGGHDHTGAVLGFWAHQPDDEVDDWHLYFRPTNAVGYSVIKSYIEDALGAGAGTVWITAKCALTCLGSALTFGIVGDCKACLDDAIAEAKNAVHDGLATIDGVFPGFGDHTSIDFYTGMGHHLNVSSAHFPGPWKLNPQAYDDRPGLLTENAGPLAIPDSVEFAAMVGADLAGMTVHYDPSLGPKRYEIIGAHDFHPDSVHRGKNDWEFLSFPHTPFTPIDNMASYGWRTFRDDSKHAAPPLGWALHAFGDAIVPMHVTGTSGWGHRPYEDAFENRLTGYLYDSDRQAAKTQGASIARRAVAWRKVILDWRRRHPQHGTDIPIRDVVTMLATWTLQRVQGPGMLVWPFNPAMSSDYVVPGPTKAGSIFYYENAPGADAVNRDLLEEGIAAELAFLVAVGEALP